MPTVLSMVWALLSLLTAALATLGFLRPVWFVHPLTARSLGVFGYCIPGAPDSQELMCGTYGGGVFSLSSLPSRSWQAGCVLLGGGCLLLGLSALAAVTSLCLPVTKQIAVVVGYVQFIGVMVLWLGLVVLPMGLDARLVQHFCPGADSYKGGECQLGWAYMLSLVAAALAVFCPFLSRYTDLSLMDHG